MRRWLLFGGPGYEDLMDSLFLPINNQVCVCVCVCVCVLVDCVM